jgi:hypothetical protein
LCDNIIIFIINFSSMIENMNPQNPSVWSNFELAKEELLKNSEEVDYNKIINNDTKVLFLADTHWNNPICDNIADHAKTLKEAGITHFAIEYPKTDINFELLKDLPQRLAEGPVDLSWLKKRPGINEAVFNYDVAVRETAKAGIETEAIDIVQDGSMNPIQREEAIAANIKAILDKDPNAKVAVLIGGAHTLKKYNSPERGLSCNARLMEQGVPTVAVQFVGGYETEGITSVLTPAKLAQLNNKEWMLDMTAYKDSEYVPFGKGETDVLIHLPEIYMPSPSLSLAK